MNYHDCFINIDKLSPEYRERLERVIREKEAKNRDLRYEDVQFLEEEIGRPLETADLRVIRGYFAKLEVNTNPRLAVDFKEAEIRKSYNTWEKRVFYYAHIPGNIMWLPERFVDKGDMATTGGVFPNTFLNKGVRALVLKNRKGFTTKIIFFFGKKEDIEKRAEEILEKVFPVAHFLMWGEDHFDGSGCDAALIYTIKNN